MAEARDDLFLRVASKRKFEGVCARFRIKVRRIMEVENKFWRPNKHPDGLQHALLFDVVDYFPGKRITKADLEMADFPQASKLLKVPQKLASEITETEGNYSIN